MSSYKAQQKLCYQFLVLWLLIVSAIYSQNLDYVAIYDEGLENPKIINSSPVTYTEANTNNRGKSTDNFGIYCNYRIPLSQYSSAQNESDIFTLTDKASQNITIKWVKVDSYEFQIQICSSLVTSCFFIYTPNNCTVSSESNKIKTFIYDSWQFFGISISFPTQEIYFFIGGYGQQLECYGIELRTISNSSSIFMNGFSIEIGGTVSNLINGLQFTYLRLLDNEYLISYTISRTLATEQIKRSIYLDFMQLNGNQITNQYNSANLATVYDTTSIDITTGVFTCAANKYIEIPSLIKPSYRSIAQLYFKIKTGATGKNTLFSLIENDVDLFTLSYDISAKRFLLTLKLNLIRSDIYNINFDQWYMAEVYHDSFAYIYTSLYQFSYVYFKINQQNVQKEDYLTNLQYAATYIYNISSEVLGPRKFQIGKGVSNSFTCSQVDIANFKYYIGTNNVRTLDNCQSALGIRFDQRVCYYCFKVNNWCRVSAEVCINKIKQINYYIKQDRGYEEDCDYCDTTCKTCSGPSETECISCDETFNLILVNGRCVICGNGRKIVEQCDDGNRIKNDGCDNMCQVEIGWECIGGTDRKKDKCQPICGDGRRIAYEKCDNGNTESGDGCSSTCTVEEGWICEGGDFNNADVCTCEPRDEYGKFGNTWEDIYIIYDKRLQLLNPSFDQNIISKEFCEYIFTTKTLNKLGIGYSCSFYGKINEQIKINLGKNSSIIKQNKKLLDNDTIEFIPKRLLYQFCPIPKTTKSLIINIMQNQNIIVPFINFTYPKSISLCDPINITLNNLQLFGKRSNDPEYSIIWKITYMNIDGEPQNNTIVKSYSQNLTKNFSTLTPNTSLILPSLYFPIDTQINISITVTNFLKTNYTFNLSILTTKLPLPDLSLNLQDNTQTYTTRYTNIEVYASLPKCNGISDLSSYLGYSLNTLSYEWRQISPFNHKIDNQSFFTAQKNNKFLIIPPYSLKPLNTYEFSVRVYPQQKQDAFTIKRLKINIVPSKLYVYIQGGNRIASVQRDLVLLGNTSRDPDIENAQDSLKSLDLEWLCVYDNQTVCEYLNGTQIRILKASPVLVISKYTVLGDLNYTFTLTAKKDTRKSNYTIRVQMKSILTPLVGISNPKLILNRNEPNVFDLRVFSRMPDSIIYNWTISWISNNTIDYVQPNQTQTQLNRKTIKIEAWTIPNYIKNILVSVEIQDYYGYGWSSYEPTINILPSCSNLIISPPDNGIELITLFTTEMLDCYDTDGIIIEFKYVYYTSLEDINNFEYKSNPLTEYQFSSNAKLILPQGQIYLQGLIRDQDNGISNVTIPVVVQPFTALQIELSQKFIDRILQDTPYDFYYQRSLALQIMLSSLSSTNQSISINPFCSNNCSGKCIQISQCKCYCQCAENVFGQNCELRWDDYELGVNNRIYLLNTINQYIETIPIDGVKNEILYFVLENLSHDYYLIDSRLSVLVSQIIQKQLQTILNNTNIYKMVEYSKILSTIGNLINQQGILYDISGNTNQKVQSNLTMLQQLVQNVVQKLLDQDVPKEAQKQIETMNMNITAIKVTPDTLLPNSTSLQSSQLQLPKDGLLQVPKRFSELELPNDEEIYNMKMINWVVNPLIRNISSINSQILSIELDRLGSQTSTKQALNNNITFVQTFKTNLTNSSMCSYFSFTSSQWETDGCSTVARNQYNLTCTCNHLTDFGISSNDFNKVYYSTNGKEIFEEPNFSNFNLLRSPSFYVLALLSYVCLNLIIQGRITEPYFEVENYVINKTWETPFLKYSYLYCKLKNVGSFELKNYLKTISIMKAFSRDFQKAYKMAHPLIGPITSKSAFITRQSKLFIYYLRCLGVIGTSLIFFKDPNVEYTFTDKFLISLLSVPITSGIALIVTYLMKFDKPRKIRRYYYAAQPVYDEDERQRLKTTNKNIIGICIGLMFITFIMYAMFAIETKINNQTKIEWLKTYLLGFFTSQAIAPSIKAALDCLFIIVVAKRPIDSNISTFLKKIINQDIIAQYGI